jgi:small GTP-binding protein
MIGSLLGRKKILSEQQADLRAREIELLNRLESSLQKFGPDISSADLQRFGEAREQLQGLFLLVVAGEFNSGKSSFINALLGERVLPEGATPTTDKINVLKHGKEVTEALAETYLLERTHPATLLQEMNIVDTPGTNAVIRRHEELTRDFIPRCDLVLFITSADRPFTESERAFLEQIKLWGKKILFVINKIDILAGEHDKAEVVDYVRTNAMNVLGANVEIFPLSSRQAQISRSNRDEQMWEKSGFQDFENYLFRTLDQEERVRLKLLNPLNVGLRLATLYKEEAYKRLKMLAADIAALENMDRQLAGYHQEMLRDFQPKLNAAESLLQEMNSRGMAFFDENVRIGRFRNLLRAEKLREGFEKEVIGETPRELEDEVQRIMDWMADRHYRLWQDITNYIDRQKISRHRDEIVGEVGSSFHYNRQALFQSIGAAARDVMNRYERQLETRAMAKEVCESLATTALTEAGAVGLGALLVVLAHTALADFTGIVTAALVAAGGLYIIPSKRRQVKRRFASKVQELRKQLSSVLTRQIHNEITASSDRINESIAPYRRFIMLQQEQVSEAQANLVTAENALLRLKGEIERA